MHFTNDWYYDIWHDLWHLMVGQTIRSPWTLLFVCPWSTCWLCYFHHLKQFQILTFFDLWPLSCRLDDEVNVNTSVCLSMIDRFTFIFIIWNRFKCLPLIVPLAAGGMRSMWKLLHVCPCYNIIFAFLCFWRKKRNWHSCNVPMFMLVLLWINNKNSISSLLEVSWCHNIQRLS